jgi:hypothetical protein
LCTQEKLMKLLDGLPRHVVERYGGLTDKDEEDKKPEQPAVDGARAMAAEAVGLDAGATDAEISRAYKNASLFFHPGERRNLAEEVRA